LKFTSKRYPPAFRTAHSLLHIFSVLFIVLALSVRPAFAGHWNLRLVTPVNFTHFANGNNFGSPVKYGAAQGTDSFSTNTPVTASVGSSPSTANATFNVNVICTWVPDPSLSSDPIPRRNYAKVDSMAWASAQSGPETSVVSADNGQGDPSYFIPNVQGKNYVLSSGTHVYDEPNSPFTISLSLSAKSIDYGSQSLQGLAAVWLGGVTITMGAPPSVSLALWDCAKSWSTHLDFSDGEIGSLSNQSIASQQASHPFKPVVGAAVDGASKILLECDSTTSTPVLFSSGLYIIKGGPVLKSNGLYASYAVYSVPDVTSAFPTNGQMTNSVTFTVTSGSSSDSRPLTLGRAPVVLAHGLWDSAGGWSASTGTMPLLKAKGFYVTAVEYMNTNHSSFETNKNAILENPGGIRAAINNYHAYQWAVSKADVIGHSMGGVITRYFASQPEYANVDNYYKGSVHRLVTIGSPHMGSPESQLYYWFYLSDYNALSGDKAADLYARSAQVGAARLPGLAVRDLSPGSAASQRIHNPSFPATLPAFAEIGNAGAMGWIVPAACQVFIGLEKLFGGPDLGTVFVDNSKTDQVVSWVSQQGSIPAQFSTKTNVVVHTDPVPWLYKKEQSSPDIGNDIISQLFLDNFSTNGFPSPPGSDPASLLNTPNQFDPNGLMATDVSGLPPWRFMSSPSVTTVSVTSPTPGQVFASGDSVTTTFTPNSGSTIDTAVVTAYTSNGSALYSMTVTAAPYTATFTIPQTTLGNVSVNSVAIDTAGNTSEASTNIIVSTSATLQVVAVIPTTSSMTPLTLTGIGMTEHLQVSGSYSDWVVRDITQYQTLYSSSNTSVATVSSTGLVTAVGNGVAQITVTNGGKVDTIPVTVALQAPQVLATSPLGANAGQTVALRLDGMNFGGASNIQFMTPAGVPDPNVSISGATLSPDGYMLTANVAIAANCPVEQDTIIVTAGGGSTDPLTVGDYGVFTVLPNANTLSLSSNTAQGVQTIDGKVLLNAPAPDSGVTLTLSSSDPSVTVPASITIDPGCISKTFPVTTSQVVAPTIVTITATSGGVNATATLTETP
jgi:pimeloyl-ACP methyl ester carboxylesterase